MIIGECSRDGDLDVNPTKEKKLTNVRNTGSEEQARGLRGWLCHNCGVSGWA